MLDSLPEARLVAALTSIRRTRQLHKQLEQPLNRASKNDKEDTGMGQQANDQPTVGDPKTAAAPAVDRARPSSADFDVLVVGGGPTGLLAACELLRGGVRVRIIDRALEPMKAPKALSLWPRVLDILDDLGAGHAIRRASVRINAFSYFSDRRPLASFSFPDDLAARQLPQPETERVLTERLHALGGKVERGVRLLELDDVDFSSRIEATNGVTAVLEHGDGAVERVRSPFVIGADGAGSAVRGQLGIGFQGTTYEMAFALIDTRIEGYLPSDEILYYQAPAGTLVIVPQPDGVFRFLSVMPEGGQELSVPMMQAILDERAPGECGSRSRSGRPSSVCTHGMPPTSSAGGSSSWAMRRMCTAQPVVRG